MADTQWTDTGDFLENVTPEARHMVSRTMVHKPHPFVHFNMATTIKLTRVDECTRI
jgi:hypothetical protein